MALNNNTYLTFDIGGTKVASACVSFDMDGTYHVSHHDRIATQAERGGADVLRRIVEFVGKRLEFAREEHIEISGIGIGSAGVVDSASGRILTATDTMPGWAGSEVVAAIRELPAAQNMPIYMVGDVGAHGLGESLCGVGRGYKGVLSIGIGTGIGGAVISQGILHTGAHGVAGHVGHMTHPLGRGIMCSCGTRAGHIEPVASGTGLATLYNVRREQELELGVEVAANGADVVHRMEQGEEFAQSVVAESARALGECIAGMGNLIDPDIIVLSGSVTKAGKIWWNALRAGFEDSALPLVAQTPVVEGILGDDAPLIGAATAIRKFINS
ncbi:ROK family protein [Alloscardovia theropitheci]|uniref:ROK family protein n=1 Tax=Alloscardovia theropitheci TaxID=2496842 RepID=A0A4R0QVL1_9BIFI|nr:ROK family protein [Alloscardovia theropitheci]TCD54257.1 ROK family protein [Alloscardovia theropitheci]